MTAVDLLLLLAVAVWFVVLIRWQPRAAKPTRDVENIHMVTDPATGCRVPAKPGARISHDPPMFDVAPVWRPNVSPRLKDGPYVVGCARRAEPGDPAGRVPMPRTAIAWWSESRGRWSYDPDGFVELDFPPDWIGPAPCAPPWLPE